LISLRQYFSKFMAARSFLSVWLVLGCGLVQHPDSDRTQWVRTELYFGSSKPDGARVTEGEWEGFVGREIVRRFPAGFTVLMANGYWGVDGGQTVTEVSHVVVVLHALDSSSEASINDIRSAYKQEFRQESVLRVDQPANASF
jgi:hypothetical protein